MPRELLSSFIGENVNGDWTIKIEDVVNTNQGAFNNFSFEICTTDGKVSIEEILESNFSIYPNPANGSFTIDVTNYINPLQGSIYSTTGQKINSFNVNSNTTVIDISTLPKGGIR